MRVTRVCALMMTLLLVLCSCGEQMAGRGNDELALDIRTKFLGMTGCTATMEVKADYGQRVYEYTMDLAYEKEGETLLTVIAPTEIAGITARLANGSAVMEYDGISLETGPLDTDGLSPVGAAPALLEAVCRGYMAETAAETLFETECLRVTYRDPESQPGTGTELTVWFDAVNQTMLQGEIYSDGAMVVQCVFTAFQMMEA